MRDFGRSGKAAAGERRPTSRADPNGQPATVERGEKLLVRHVVADRDERAIALSNGSCGGPQAQDLPLATTLRPELDGVPPAKELEPSRVVTGEPSAQPAEEPGSHLAVERAVVKRAPERFALELRAGKRADEVASLTRERSRAFGRGAKRARDGERTTPLDPVRAEHHHATNRHHPTRFDRRSPRDDRNAPPVVVHP